ncbi:MAG: DNA polymerase III subunit [Planctomycetales bacterium]|nr:DNA polymerase III subunit [Planctomycetales bacterium]MCA9182802.1 DNA polymerase III subunit [Planctomycetales bacterium]
MQWDSLLGHQQQKQWFQTALDSGRLASSFLFVGPEGIGKRTFAILLAKGLLCRHSPPQSLEACGNCEDCVQVDAGTHPDLLSVSKPIDKANIPIELLIGEREKRMRAGLCHDISLRPYGGRRKIAIVDDADTFNNEGANCLLKTLEEPPAGSLLILLGTSLQRQLPTIRSRCQAILFKPLDAQQLQTLLLRTGLTDSADRALQLASQAGGSLEEARLMVDPELDEFRGHLLENLGKPQLPLIELAKSCAAIVDAAGKDARVKRERLKLIFRIAASFYRELSLSLSAASSERVLPRGDNDLSQAVEMCCKNWKSGSRGATSAWDRCLLASEQVNRNANQATLLEAWAADIARLGGV